MTSCPGVVSKAVPPFTFIARQCIFMLDLVRDVVSVPWPSTLLCCTPMFERRKTFARRSLCRKRPDTVLSCSKVVPLLQLLTHIRCQCQCGDLICERWCVGLFRHSRLFSRCSLFEVCSVDQVISFICRRCGASVVFRSFRSDLCLRVCLCSAAFSWFLCFCHVVCGEFELFFSLFWSHAQQALLCVPAWGVDRSREGGVHCGDGAAQFRNRLRIFESSESHAEVGCELLGASSHGFQHFEESCIVNVVPFNVFWAVICCCL
ncbi:hypothetical protein TRVL_06491 [Trypanosoma vivax]|nr:hypothetical protein TRVL_06491 [Trypanosoma vivax]